MKFNSKIGKKSAVFILLLVCFCITAHAKTYVVSWKPGRKQIGTPATGNIYVLDNPSSYHYLDNVQYSKNLSQGWVFSQRFSSWKAAEQWKNSQKKKKSTTQYQKKSYKYYYCGVKMYFNRMTNIAAGETNEAGIKKLRSKGYSIQIYSTKDEARKAYDYTRKKNPGAYPDWKS